MLWKLIIMKQQRLYCQKTSIRHHCSFNRLAWNQTIRQKSRYPVSVLPGLPSNFVFEIISWQTKRLNNPCLRGLVGYTSNFKSDFPHSCEFKSRSNCFISISMWNTAYATTYVLYNTLTATALTEKMNSSTIWKHVVLPSMGIGRQFIPMLRHRYDYRGMKNCMWHIYRY